MAESAGTGHIFLSAYVLLGISMCLNAFANFLIKLSVQGREFSLRLEHLPETVKALALNPLLWAGVVFFGVALAGYSLALSRLNLSTAYPVMAGGGFLLVFVLSALYLRETITAAHLGGAALILAGMWILLR